MANITAADVKKLRDATGVGMMECKKALTEAEGDFEKAVEILRISGSAKAAKRAERAASNGLIAQHGGTIVELLCETDFVAKNTDFQTLAQRVAAAADAARPTDTAGLQSLVLDSGKTVAEIRHAYGQYAEVEHIKTLAPADLEIFKEENQVVVAFAYERRIPLAGNVSLLIDFSGSSSARYGRAATMIERALATARSGSVERSGLR